MAARTFQKNGPLWRGLYEWAIQHKDFLMMVRMNELTGEPLVIVNLDKSTAITGTAVATPTRGALMGNGIYGMTLNGTTQCVSLGTVPAALRFTYLQPFSTLFIGKPTVTGAYQHLIGCERGSVNYDGWSLLIDPANKVRFYYTQTSGAGITVRADVAISTGFMCLGSSYSGSGAASGVALYKDGIAVADTDLLDTLTGSPTYTFTMNLGATGGSFTPLTGGAGPVILFDAALPAKDFAIAAHLIGLKAA